MATSTRTGPAAAPPVDPGPVSLPRDGGHHVRGDIEGLRAVAVLLVIAEHLLGWPHGGFVGVDVFFVISGFLITGLLLREHRANGRISFADFYRRRIRRILPASVLVLVVTVVAAQIVFFAGRARTTTDDAIWSLLFAGNWRFALEGTDYMQAGGPTSPLQHYWSLSVEEQFYFVWPAVMALILGLAGWRRRHRRKGLGAITATMAVIAGASWLWALHETSTEPTWAYFSTFSRAWELGLGALLAIAAPAVERIPGRLRPLLGWAGLAGIVASAFVIDADTPFPAPGALLPVLSTVAVIAAGTGGESRQVLLDNPVGRHVGALSYSLYLWHFPVIVIAAVLMPVDGTYYALVAGITGVAAIASFHLVEQPIRRSAWLRPGAVRPARPVRRLGQWAGATAVGAAAALLVVGQVSGFVWPWDKDAVARATPPAVAEVVAPRPGVPTVDPQTVLAEEISASLAASEWPELTPSLDALGDAALAPEWTQDDCLRVSDDNVDDCMYGDPAAPRTAVVLGDSISISWMPGLRRALGDDWRIQSLTLGQCPQPVVEVNAATDIPGFAEICRNHRTWVLDQLPRFRPDLVIVTSATNSLDRLVSGASGDAALAEWREGMTAMLAALDTAPTRVAVLAAPPGGENLQECATRFNGPSDCVSSRSDRYDALVAAERAAVEAFRPTALQVSYVETAPWVCDTSGRCPAIVGTTPVFADGNHLSAAYAARLAPVLAPVLTG